MLDFEIQRCTRRCHATDRELAPGEPYYAALVAQAAEVVRRDFSDEAWQGPPENCLGWWRSRVPEPHARATASWAPNDVMLDYFEQLHRQPDRQDAAYVLALLLVRRRVLRQERATVDGQGQEQLVLYCPRNESTYTVPAATPAAERISQIQEELARLLTTGDSAGSNA